MTNRHSPFVFPQAPVDLLAVAVGGCQVILAWTECGRGGPRRGCRPIRNDLRLYPATPFPLQKMLETIGQTPVRKSDKPRFAFRTDADTQGRRKGSACGYSLEYRGSALWRHAVRARTRRGEGGSWQRGHTCCGYWV